MLEMVVIERSGSSHCVYPFYNQSLIYGVVTISSVVGILIPPSLL